jgi:hypothetical protein
MEGETLTFVLDIANEDGDRDASRGGLPLLI